MHRFVLAAAQWAKIEPLRLGEPADPDLSGGDNRLFLEAVPWIARTGSPWRDLPHGGVQHGGQVLCNTVAEVEMPAKLGKSRDGLSLKPLPTGGHAFALCSGEWTVPQI
jgi:hypothetical protein